MAGTSSDYSFSLTTFSPSGKLVQIEHALAAVAAGATALAIRAVDGVVIAAEKKIPGPLLDDSSIQKVIRISSSVGVVYAGIAPDSRVLVNAGRKAAVAYEQQYGEPMPTRLVARRLAEVMQEYTQSGGVRPFGISLLVCGFDDAGPQLFQVDPSGSFWAWKATAIGKAQLNAKTFLEKRYKNDIHTEDAIFTVLLALKEVYDGPVTNKNIELGLATEKDGVSQFKKFTPEELEQYLTQIE
ncbi:hypothetical protein P9112_006935 [Eukaryota sp. TZLM1-RC]